MSRESYIRGFCKTAMAAGLDPCALAKYASAYELAQSSANLAAMENELRPMLKQFMEGSNQGEVRNFPPQLQEKVDAYIAAGGDMSKFDRL